MNTDPNWKVGVTVSLIGKHLERLQELEQKVRSPSSLSYPKSVGLDARRGVSDTLSSVLSAQVVQELDGKLVKADKLGDAA